MINYTIQYTETENKAMQFIAADVNDWIQNVIHERARLAVDEIVAISVQKFLEAGQSIPGSKDEIVSAAFANGWVKTAAERHEEAMANLQQLGQ